ncbi:MAG TPA: glycosyltransferase [Solirubrobacteraceae bacterium]|nr:glycosyltransferase [Solirubrobacteraceae bacterium]
MRILLVTQMWPGPHDPDLGVFVFDVARELRRLGHEVDVSAIDRRGGSPAKYARLSAAAVAAARRLRPDVVFAHFLFPAGAAGAAAAAAARVPLVVMAHGTDVENARRSRALAAATRAVTARSAALISNSRWLAERLGPVRPPVHIIDCGVDLEVFAPRHAAGARAQLGWGDDGPAFLVVGSLVERKGVTEMAAAFERLGRGSLAFVGDGPLREQLEGRDGVTLVGRVDHADVPTWIAACDVLCQPSRVEPFGQAALEAMAMERSVIATKRGGPAEFVGAQTGVLVEPGDVSALIAALEQAAALPAPNPAARAAAAEHDVRTQAARMAAVLEQAVADGRRRRARLSPPR